jgi:methylated-DNA-[protein]-cysteine S-methyltransferase
MIVRKNVIDTPIGPLTTHVDETGAVVGIDFGALDGERYPEATAEVDRQLWEYFEGSRTEFDVRLADIGTPFQRRVWELLRGIPYGETRSYGQLAAVLGQPGASRAVGRANATNPIPVIVPCHRVIGSTGTLTGFAGGLDAKRWLLEFERR